MPTATSISNLTNDLETGKIGLRPGAFSWRQVHSNNTWDKIVSFSGEISYFWEQIVSQRDLLQALTEALRLAEGLTGEHRGYLGMAVTKQRRKRAAFREKVFLRNACWLDECVRWKYASACEWMSLSSNEPRFGFCSSTHMTFCLCALLHLCAD